jgi:mRNA interferase RelE/StbE
VSVYTLKLSDGAIDNFKRFNPPEQKFIADKLRYLAQNFDQLKTTKKVTELKGTDYAHYRYVIARRIRAVFEIKNDEVVLLVIKIGRRKDVYD